MKYDPADCPGGGKLFSEQAASLPPSMLFEMLQKPKTLAVQLTTDSVLAHH